MNIVDIKQLEARLSEYVRLVQGGETVLIAERDEIVAELHPARRRMLFADRLEELLDGLVTSGQLTRAVQPKGRWTWQPRPRVAIKNDAAPSRRVARALRLTALT